MAAPAAYGSCRARDWIWATAATYAAAVAMPDPLSHKARPGVRPHILSNLSQCSRSHNTLHTAGTPGCHLLKVWLCQPIFLLPPLFLLLLSDFLTAAPVTYGSSQARGGTGAAAAHLCHSHSHTGSATYTKAHSNTRSLTHWVRPGMEPTSSWILAGFVSAAPQRELSNIFLICWEGHHALKA